jgi:hypothetical protein
MALPSGSGGHLWELIAVRGSAVRCPEAESNCIERGGRVANASCKLLKFLERASAEKIGKPADALEISGAAPGHHSLSFTRWRQRKREKPLIDGPKRSQNRV